MNNKEEIKRQIQIKIAELSKLQAAEKFIKEKGDPGTLENYFKPSNKKIKLNNNSNQSKLEPDAIHVTSESSEDEEIDINKLKL